MKFVSLIVGCVVGIILIGSLLVPTVTSQPDGNVTYTNDGVRMSAVGEQTVTVSYASNMWTINGVDVGYTAQPITQGTIMVYSTGSSTRAGYFYVNNDNEYTRNSVSSSQTTTIEYVGETKTANVTSVVSGNTYTSSYQYLGEVYYIDSAGSYAWFGEKPEHAYIPSNWDKFNTWSVGADHFYAIIGEYIMVDGTISPEGVTYSSVLGDIDGIKGVKTIESYTLNIPDQEPIDCRGYILPYQVSGVNESQKSMYELMALLVPIFIIGLVVMVAYVFISRDY